MRMAVRELRALIDPYLDDVWWFSDPLTVGEVRVAVRDGHLLDEPLVIRRLDESPAEVRQRHVERVAHFVVRGWTCPLLLDGCQLVDGHHRLAAAILRGDKWVEVDVLPRGSLPPRSAKKLPWCRIGPRGEGSEGSHQGSPRQVEGDQANPSTDSLHRDGVPRHGGGRHLQP